MILWVEQRDYIDVLRERRGKMPTHEHLDKVENVYVSSITGRRCELRPDVFYNQVGCIIKYDAGRNVTVFIHKVVDMPPGLDPMETESKVVSIDDL